MLKGFTPIPNDAFGLLMACSPTAVKVYINLRHRMNRVTGRCNPSRRTIAADTSLYKDTVSAAIAELVAVGLVKARKTNRSNAYDFPELPASAGGKNPPSASRLQAGKDCPQKPDDETSAGGKNPPPGEREKPAPNQKKEPTKAKNPEPRAPKPAPPSPSSMGKFKPKLTSARPERAAPDGRAPSKRGGKYLPVDDDESAEQAADPESLELRRRYPDGAEAQALVDRLRDDFGCTTGRTIRQLAHRFADARLIREVVARFEARYARTVAKPGGYVAGLIDQAIAEAENRDKAERKRARDLAEDELSLIDALIDKLPDAELVELTKLLPDRLPDHDDPARVRRFAVLRKPLVRWLRRHPEAWQHHAAEAHAA